MWIFGHLGIGSKIAAPFSRKLPYVWILFGTLLPDLIDKPLYYGFAFATGRRGLDIGLISCARTFAHTALFVLALSMIAFIRKSTLFAALSIGVSTHLVLDGFQDYWILRVLGQSGESSLRLAALFPFYENRFGDFPYESAFEHVTNSLRTVTVVAEAIGLLILGWDYWKKKWRFKRLLRIGLPWRKPRAARSISG